MRKVIAAFISGGAAGAMAIAVATGLVLGGNTNADVALANAAPELPQVTVNEVSSSRAADSQGVQLVAKSGSPEAPQAGIEEEAIPETAPEAAPEPEPEPAAPVDFVNHFGVDPAQSSAKLIAYQTGLLGDSAAVGTGSNLTGEVFLHQSGALGASPSWFALDMRTLRSSDVALSSFFKSNLETNRFPSATFTIGSVSGIPANFADGNEFRFSMSGPLNMHGHTRQVTFTVKARQAGDFLTMAADTDFNLTDFGWTPPDYGIARAKNTVHLQFVFVAGRMP